MIFPSVVPFILQTIMWAIVRPLLSIFSRVRVFGKENLREVNGGAIFAINHLSDLDPVLIPSTLGPFSGLLPIFSVAMERSFYDRPWPLKFFYGGMVFNMLGAYAVRKGRKGDYENQLKTHIRILESGRNVGIFPEGARSRTTEIGEGRPGVAYMLWRTGRPVIPVAMSGHHSMRPRAFFARRHLITVSYGKPVTREEIFGATMNSGIPPSTEELIVAAQMIMAHIREEYEKINQTSKDVAYA